MILIKLMSKSSKKKLIVLPVLIILIGIYCFWAITKTVTPIKPNINAAVSKPIQTTSKISWPAAGQSAVGVVGTDILNTHNPQTPAPIASTAKMITALVVLKTDPLELGQQGPTITLSASDVAIYKSYVAEQGSVVPVTAGEQITEYQMLEAMLLPSANNMADSLAIWAYGSLANYAKAANTYLARQGLVSTVVGSDASGFLPNTTSTAGDLVKIGEIVMSNPVLAQIVNESTATGVPLTTSIKNINSLLGTDNVVGVKTGNTNQAGGVFVGAAKVNINNRLVTVVTANLGAPSLAQSISASLPFIVSAQNNIQNITLIKSGSVIGNYDLNWDHSSVAAVSGSNLVASVWGGDQVSLRSIGLSNLSYPENVGQVVGTISSGSNGVVYPSSSDVVLQDSFSKPSVVWRLLHP
jgi:D-alanyl-D-alanine carboxypeptidase (penicillin-binding protein 5/6)